MQSFLQPVLGLFVLITIAWLFSEQRDRVPWRLIGLGLLAQLLLALLLLRWTPAQDVLASLNGLVDALMSATNTGTQFVFGYLAGANAPFETVEGSHHFILAFQALPLLLLMSALSALLFYWGILPAVVRGFAWALQRLFGIGGTLGLGTAANIFMGMVEAPLLIRPYLQKMTRADLFAVMVAGMATVAGTVMAFYASVLNAIVPNALGHILVASVISAPAAIVIARVMVPDDCHAVEGPIVPMRSQATSAIDAITQGAINGLMLLAHVVVLLIVFVALVHLVNQLLALLPAVAGQPLSLERVFGWLLAPLAWLIGIPWAEAQVAGSLLGIKVVLNELLAFIQLAGDAGDRLSERSRLILTYALCGFANFGSLGIIIGGMGAMAPERRPEIVALGLRSIVAGMLATLCTGAVVAIVI